MLQETSEFRILAASPMVVAPKVNRCTLNDCQVTCQFVNENELVDEIENLQLEVCS